MYLCENCGYGGVEEIAGACPNCDAPSEFLVDIGDGDDYEDIGMYGPECIGCEPGAGSCSHCEYSDIPCRLCGNPSDNGICKPCLAKEQNL